MTTFKLIENAEARDSIRARIENAKPSKLNKYGAFFKSHGGKARWLAIGERVVGIAGNAAYAIYSPAGARDDTDQDRVLYYAHGGVLAHEEVVNGDAWFDGQFARPGR